MKSVLLAFLYLLKGLISKYIQILRYWGLKLQPMNEDAEDVIQPKTLSHLLSFHCCYYHKSSRQYLRIKEIINIGLMGKLEPIQLD